MERGERMVAGLAKTGHSASWVSRSWGLALALGLIAVLLAPAKADASVASDDGDSVELGLAMSAVTVRRPATGSDSATLPLAIWQSGRIGYLLTKGTPPVVVPPNQTADPEGWARWRTDELTGGFSNEWKGAHFARYQQLVAYDLDTGNELQRTDLYPWAFGDTSGYESLVLDDEKGLLYVAYANVPATVNRGVAAVHPHMTDPNRADDLCLFLFPYVSHASGSGSCVAGFHVLDAATLEPLGTIDLESVRIEGALTVPRILGLEATDGKLRILIQDRPLSVPLTDMAQATNASPEHRLGAAPHYVVQADAATGRTDWFTRVDACRAPREPAIDAESEYRDVFRLPAPGFVFKSDAGRSLYLGCYNGSGRTGTIVRLPLDESGTPYFLPAAVDAPLSESALADGPEDRQSPVAAQPPAEAFYGPDKTLSYLVDAPSGRILLRVVDGGQEVWWVFDTIMRRFVGTIGIGAQGIGLSSTIAGLDSVTGRLYILSRQRGLLVADIRSTPLSQALEDPAFQEVAPTNAIGDVGNLNVLEATEAHPTRIFFLDTLGSPTHYRSIEDSRPVVRVPELGDPDAGRTLDLDEVEGVTKAVFDGAARGYGARVLLVGGVDGAARLGPVDPIGDVYGARDFYAEMAAAGTSSATRYGRAVPIGLVRSPCTEGNRDLTLGFVGPEGPAVLDAGGGRAAAEPVSTDSALRADSELPASRCAPIDWGSLWTTALFGGSPMDEPSVPWLLGEAKPDCLSGSSKTEDAESDPVFGRFSAEVSCENDEVGGWAQARGASIDGVSVAQALSRFSVYRDEERGIVAYVESVTRGLSIDGVVRIDTVRVTAESWANGRNQPVPEAERDEDYDPNCDLERSAGTCFRRHVMGVWTPGYKCGPCGDEQALLNGLNRALGANGTVAFRDPDPDKARGSENGFQAAISKSDPERFADLVLNNDLLQTMVPGLELVRFAPAARKIDGGGPRGRQLFQFAGVEVSTSYGIQCLLVYDEAANTCSESAEPPGSIQVSLSDSEGKPLAGGAFEVRQDVDADGVLGLTDTLLPDGACVTAEDGIGTCVFENLQPGTYLVSQVAAPPGYAKSAEPWVSVVASGESRTVAFTNVSNVSTIDLTVTDENGAPLSGATFAAYPDADSDGKVAPDAQPAAECTTDEQGICTMSVPAGSYVLVQTGAPGGLEGIEPVAFTFASGGQVASVSVVNYPLDSPQAPEGAASPVYTPPVDYAPPREFVDTTHVPSQDTARAPDLAPAQSVTERIGGTVTQVIRAPGDALRLLARDSKQAVAWTAALALFCLAVLAVRRRQQGMALIES